MTDPHVRRRLLLGWPLPMFSFPLVGLVVALSTAGSTRALALSTYSTWPDVSAAWHESLVAPGAVAAGLSAAVAASLFPRRSPLSLPVRPRLGGTAVTTHLFGLVAWVLVGHVVGMAPVTAHAASTATWGHLRPLDVGVALVGLASVVATGFGVGVVLRSTKAAPVVTVMAFVLMSLPNSPALRPLALLQPVQQWTATARFVPNVFVALFSLVFAVTAVVAVVALADALLTWRNRLPPDVVGWVLAPVVLAAVAFTWRPELYVASGDPPAVCEKVRGTPVCLHQAYAKSLGTVSRAVASLEAAGADPLLRSVTDSALVDPLAAGDGDVVVSVDLSRPDPALVTQSIPEQVADQVSAVAQPAICTSGATDVEAQDLGGVVRRRILVDAGFVELADRGFTPPPETEKEAAVITEMSSARFIRFVADNRQDIVECRLTEKDFVVR
jgi:hypothetical protein